jgi:MFS family permease
MILDGGAFFLPERWISSFLTWCFLEPMPHSVYLSYLLQAAGYFQIAIGAFVWVIATDVVRYRPLVIMTIAIFLVGAPVFYAIDASIGLPWWWCVIDFISAFLCGAFPLAFCLWPAKTPPNETVERTA